MHPSNRDLIKMAMLFLLTLALFTAVEGRIGNNCVCSFTGPCKIASDGTPIRYYQCIGNCYAYSDYERYPQCADPNFKPRELFQSN